MVPPLRDLTRALSIDTPKHIKPMSWIEKLDFWTRYRSEELRKHIINESGFSIVNINMMEKLNILDTDTLIIHFNTLTDEDLCKEINDHWINRLDLYPGLETYLIDRLNLLRSIDLREPFIFGLMTDIKKRKQTQTTYITKRICL